MEFDDVAAAGALVEAVHVLGDERELREEFFHFDQSEVGGIWFGIGDEFAPPFVPFPDEAGISPEGARRGEVFGAIFGPKAGLGIAKSGDAAFGGDARASENNDTFGGGEALEQIGWNRHAPEFASQSGKRNEDYNF